MKQFNLFTEKRNLNFGGSLLTGKRKSRRPLDTRKPVHLVLKATTAEILLRHRSQVEEVVRRFGKKMGIQTYGLAVHADHIHFAIKVPSRQIYIRWIRGLTSLLCQRISGLKWRLRPFTRIGAWGRAFENLLNYIRKNRIEGEFIVTAHEVLERVRREAFDLAFGRRRHPGSS